MIKESRVTVPYIRDIIVLLTISLYMLLNYGFALIRIPPVEGGGVPIGELVLLFYLATIKYPKLWSELISKAFIIPFLIWWALGIGRAIFAVPEHGMWALRDATHVIESLFLIVGFVFAARPGNIDRFFRWLPVILIFVCIYALGYPYATMLKSISPTITAAAGHEAAIFFNYQGTHIILLMAACYFIIFESRRPVVRWMNVIIAICIIGYVVMLFQVRTVYIQLIAIFTFFAFYRRSAFIKGLLCILVILLALKLVTVFGFDIIGRRKQAASIEFVVSHFTSGFVLDPGVSSTVPGGGLAMRMGWWIDLYHRWFSDFGTFLFGMGYGKPLIEFVGDGVIVREPHNSFISVVARLGAVGGAAFLFMHLFLLRAWHRGYKYSNKVASKKWKNRLLILMTFFILVIVNSMTQDALEKPYLTIPYYFFWGMILYFGLNFKSILSSKKDNPQL